MEKSIRATENGLFFLTIDPVFRMCTRAYLAHLSYICGFVIRAFQRVQRV